MSLSGRIERLERNLPESEVLPEYTEEEAQEALELLRATVTHRGHDSYEANELRSELGEESYEKLFGDVKYTAVAPCAPGGVS